MKTHTLMAAGVLAAGLLGLNSAAALDFSVGPMGSYYDADKAGDAWGGGVIGRLGILDWFAVDARASYLDIEHSDLNMVPLEAAATFRLPLFENRLVPYAGAGVGYYLYEEDSDRVDAKDDVGYFPLVGLEYRFGSNQQWALFGEARWLFISSSIKSAGDQLDDFNSDDIDGFGANVGILYRF